MCLSLAVTSRAVLLTLWLVASFENYRAQVIHYQVTVSTFYYFFLDDGALECLDMLDAVDHRQIGILLFFTFLYPCLEFLLSTLPRQFGLIIDTAAQRVDIALSRPAQRVVHFFLLV